MGGVRLVVAAALWCVARPDRVPSRSEFEAYLQREAGTASKKRRRGRKEPQRSLEEIFHTFDAEETQPDGFMVGGGTDGTGNKRSWEFNSHEAIKRVMMQEAFANMKHRSNVTSSILAGGTSPADAFIMEQRRRRAIERARKGGDVCAPFDKDWKKTDELESGNWSIPEITAAQMTPANVRRAINDWGAVIVRGLLPDAAEIARLRDLIDHAFDRQLEGTADYAPPDDIFERFEHLVMAVLSGQGLLAVYSPTAAEYVLKVFERAGLLDLLRGYFGDEPAVSTKKWTLRRGTGLTFPGWHQDGFFMDKGSQYLNMWIALSECGAGTPRPGLTVVPKRVVEFLPVRNYIVLRHKTLQERYNRLTVTPVFKEGDAFFFDEYYVHSTQFHFGNKAPGVYRYAVETWFHPRCTVDNDYSTPMAWGW